MKTAGVTNINFVLKLKRNKNKTDWINVQVYQCCKTYCHNMYLINSLHLSLMSVRHFQRYKPLAGFLLL